jgi:phosphatidylserine decarboxylase
LDSTEREPERKRYITPQFCTSVIAKGAGYWIAVPLVLGAISMVLAVQMASYVLYILANVFFLASVTMIILFRDPPRNIGKGVVSPADGKVIYVNRERNTLTISTTLLKVHVNRAPIGGRTLQVEMKKQNGGTIETSLATEIGLVKIGQRPKLAPKRVITYVGRGRRLKKGQRIGVVVPSAFVSVELPKSVRIVINEGQKVLAGETSVGELTGAGYY